MNPMRNGPIKIILINAGKYEYAEVSLDGAIQIVGRNNSGKSTLINTLHFLYIDDRSKMAFGSYTFDQTLDYYFTSEHSYVLFECRTVRGQVVIGWRGASKASGADPERFFYLGPYRREDFFDERSRVRKPTEINTLLIDREYQSLKKPAEHRAILLSNAEQRNNGLGIVALKDGERFSDFRDTLKNLLNLANITQDQMRERLLMLAGLPTDYVAIDARRVLGDDYEQLRRERDELSLFKTHQEDVGRIIQSFNERQVLWGQLNYRWEDLKARKKRFDESHAQQITTLEAKINTTREAALAAKQSFVLKGEEKERLLQDKSPVEVQLKNLESNKKTYAGFAEQFEQVALEKLERELSDLLNRQQEASNETVASVRSQLQAAENEVEATTKSIQHFSRLAITSLREHFPDEEISRLFRILNPDLLGLAVGRTGVTLSNQKEVVARLRQLVSRITDGVYQDDSMTVCLGPASDVLAKFQNVESLEKELERQKKNVARLTALLEAVTRQQETANKIDQLKKQKQEQTDKLAAYKQYQKNLADETKWKEDIRNLDRAINAAAKAIAELDAARENHRDQLSKLDTERKVADAGYQEVLKRYDQCRNRIALFNASPRADAEIPDDFDSAVSFYLREHSRASDMSRDLELAFVKLGVFADRYKGSDEAETVRNLEQELDALSKREEALQLRWNSQIHALKGRFQEVLNDLKLVESAKDKLNRELARIQVSDLKSVKLTVERQADEVSLIERLANIGELNLLDDTTPLDKVFERVRAKMGRNPVTRIADLFVLGVNVTRADNTVKKYPDFRQVESDGTTITIKVLFNLLVLKSLLHKEDVAIPFFLDEIQDLDPANQRAVIQTAKKLGFIAITAAPSAIGEVDSCYFLEPDNRGRVVLTDDQRLSMKVKTQPQEA
jgi:energy-coupling factor transporter ATP-binding protein EcfA2